MYESQAKRWCDWVFLFPLILPYECCYLLRRLQLCVAARIEEDFQQRESEHLGPVDAVLLQRQRLPH